MKKETSDILVVGAGIAGLSAALTARERGVSVTVLECAPVEERGGNTRFSNGAMRGVYAGVDDIEALVGGLSEAEKARADFGAYSREQYFDDMARVTQYRTDPDLCELLVDRSRDTMRWLHGHGVQFLPIYESYFAGPDGRIHFAGGSAVEVNGAGEAVSDALFKAAEKSGVRVLYGTRALALIENESGVTGVHVRQGRASLDIRAKAVVLAAGGFEANAEWRTRYLGPGWELAKVRGSRFNIGDGLRMALDVGAMPFGNWSGCHSASWDLNAPDVNELALGSIFKRDDFVCGIVVNARGERFVDEGADLRSLAYAKLGRVVLAQPGQVAWQIYDNKVLHLLHGEYRVRQSARFRADTLEALAAQLEGIERTQMLATIHQFNAAVPRGIPYDASRKDGRSTQGLAMPKSNWALTIDQPPFEAYAVTCGITFTFGGVRTDSGGRVMDVQGAPIPGLFAAGAMVGGLFYFNYPGGSGLVSAAVLGRTAGAAASALVASG
jgi:tricarballylate dehydrogenase